MNKSFEKIKKEITAAEAARKAFIAKFQNSLSAIDAEIEQCEENLRQAISSEDFDTFESESNRLALLQQKKKKYEDGMADAEAAVIGDYDGVRAQIEAAVKEFSESKLKEMTQYSSAMLKIASEIENARKEANILINLMRSWTDKPVFTLDGHDLSAAMVEWGKRVDVYLYQQTAAKHPEWTK